jgi:hypothetical protein
LLIVPDCKESKDSQGRVPRNTRTDKILTSDQTGEKAVQSRLKSLRSSPVTMMRLDSNRERNVNQYQQRTSRCFDRVEKKMDKGTANGRNINSAAVSRK